jgi:hypothetical protein
VIASTPDPPSDNLADQTSTFSVPAPDQFDASFSLEVCPEDSRDDSSSQFDFFSSLNAGDKSADLDFDAIFGVDVPAWNEAVFGEPPSQESTPSSSTSFWEFMSKEEPSVETSAPGVGTGVHTDIQFQFPSVNTDTIGDGNGLLTEDEFLRAVMETVQSTPKRVSWIS